MKATNLVPNCSEYVWRIRFTKEELVLAKKMAKKFHFSADDLKLFEKHLRDGRDEKPESFGSFIEEGLDKPYEFIRDTILELREVKAEDNDHTHREQMGRKNLKESIPVREKGEGRVMDKARGGARTRKSRYHAVDSKPTRKHFRKPDEP